MHKKFRILEPQKGVVLRLVVLKDIQDIRQLCQIGYHK